MVDMFMKLCGVMHNFSVPYVFRGHGQVERMHETCNLQLRAMNNVDHWDVQVPLIAYNMNTATHSALGCTPCEVVFGRNPSSIVLDKLEQGDRWKYMQE
eukprot:Nk52_evm1s2180 gene=Nk52_evmTU1s2180